MCLVCTRRHVRERLSALNNECSHYPGYRSVVPSSVVGVVTPSPSSSCSGQDENPYDSEDCVKLSVVGVPQNYGSLWNVHDDSGNWRDSRKVSAPAVEHVSNA